MNLCSTCNVYRMLASFLGTHNIQFHKNIINWFTFSCRWQQYSYTLLSWLHQGQ
jgi:hypothetical protein